MVAIVGLGPSHDQVPWETVETWGVAWDPWAPRFDLLFEMHERRLYETRGEEYISRLNDMDIPVVMQMADPEIERSETYPLKDVIRMTGDYFGSSVAYMLGLAILRRVDEVSLFGVDLTDDHDHQRPNLEYMLGIATGRGIKVNVPDGSLLLSRRKRDTYQGIGVIYPKRYGSF